MMFGRSMAAALMLALSACGSAAQSPSSSAAAKADEMLTVTAASGVHRFRVEMARTPDEQARGLMFRDRLDPDAGMLFPLGTPRVASFWMKNTLIPLDIIFIRADGSIESIAANTVPYSLAPVTSGEPVVAVFEIAGGRAAQLGIAPGDKVVWPKG
jgi:uncharacterized protein